VKFANPSVWSKWAYGSYTHIGASAAVTNSYNVPTSSGLTVTKTFSGLTADEIQAMAEDDSNPFYIEVYQSLTKDYRLLLNDSGVTVNGSTYTWNVSDLDANASCTVSEHNALAASAVNGYTLNVYTNAGKSNELDETSTGSGVYAQTISSINPYGGNSVTFVNDYSVTGQMQNTATFTIKKQDVVGATLTGAVFKLYTESSNLNDSNVAATSVDNGNGTYTVTVTNADFSKLTPNYDESTLTGYTGYLVETTAPEGYEAQLSGYNVTFSQGNVTVNKVTNPFSSLIHWIFGEVGGTEWTWDSNAQQLVITNNKIPTLTVTKTIVGIDADNWNKIPVGYSTTVSYGSGSVTFNKSDFTWSDAAGGYTAQSTTIPLTKDSNYSVTDGGGTPLSSYKLISTTYNDGDSYSINDAAADTDYSVNIVDTYNQVVKFFVNLSGTQTNVGSTFSDHRVGRLYGTGMVATTATDAATVRAALNAITINSGSIPTAKNVLNQLTEPSGITAKTVEGVDVDWSNMNTDHYGIQWYVLREGNNGWRVDGVLTAKTGPLTITYTISGVPSLPDGFTVTANYSKAVVLRTAASGTAASGTATVTGFTKQGDGSFVGTTTVPNVPIGSYAVSVASAPGIANYECKSSDNTKQVSVSATGGTAALSAMYGAPPDKPTAFLTINKEVEADGDDLIGARASDMQYTFDIAGTDIYQAPVSGKLTVSANGSSQISLPYGTYTVTEETDALNAANTLNGYTWSGVQYSVGEEETSNVTLSSDGAAVTATNTYTRDTGDLTVTKTFTGLSAERINSLTNFTITVVDADGAEHVLRLSDEDVTKNGTSYSWALKLPTGNAQVIEANAGISNYTLTTSYKDSDSGEEANIGDAVVNVLTGATNTMAISNAYTSTSTYYYGGGGGDDYDLPVVIPNNPTPLSPTPGTTTDIPDGDVPQTEIPDEETPLAATPAKTGDNLILWVLAAGASGIGLVWVSLLGKKRRDEDGSQN